MRRLIDRWLLKKGYRSTLEQRLMRQCIMTGIFLVTGIMTITVSTWALFSQEVFIGSFEAEIATYKIQISKDGKKLKDTITTISSGERTKFTLKASGSAATGYSVVNIDGVEYVTEQMSPGDKITFFVKVRGNETEDTLSEQEIEIEFIPEWGLSPLLDGRTTFRKLSKEEKEELDEYLISPGEVIYCGEEVEVEDKAEEPAVDDVATSSNAKRVTKETTTTKTLK